MTKQTLAITLDREVVKAIDSKRGLVKRSTYINSVLSRETHEREVSKETDKSFDHASGGKQ